MLKYAIPLQVEMETKEMAELVVELDREIAGTLASNIWVLFLRLCPLYVLNS